MTASRLLFAALVGVLIALAVAAVALSTGTAEGAEVLWIVVSTVVGVGVLLLSVRILRGLRR